MIYLAAYLYVCGVLVDVSHRLVISEIKKTDYKFADFVISLIWPILLPLALISEISLRTKMLGNDPR